MTLRPFSALLALLLALPLTAGCGKDKATPSPEPTSPKAAEPDKTPKGDAEKATGEVPKEHQAAYSVTAARITEEFHKNAVAAEKKYQGKLIAVEGTVLSTYQNSVRQIGGIVLTGSNPKSDVRFPLQVSCDLKKKFVARVGLLGKGQKVRVKGTFANASGGNVTLMEAEYEELTPSSLPRLMAETLAKEFAADFNAAQKKYGDKEVIVTGMVIDLLVKDGERSVKLAGNDKVRIACVMDEDEFKSLKKGEKVQIKGEVFQFVAGEVVILSAFLIGKGS
jgi:hypothetical protein